VNPIGKFLGRIGQAVLDNPLFLFWACILAAFGTVGFIMLLREVF
jgi:hypothetical protein